MNRIVKNKKGSEMTIGTIIIIVLALVVLVILVVGFTGGWTNLWDKIKAFFGGGDNVGTMVQACTTACASNLQFDYCLKERQLKFGDKSGKDGTYNCKAIETLGVGLTCDKNFEGCGAIKPCRTEKPCEGIDASNCENVGCLVQGTPQVCVATGGKCDNAKTKEVCTNPCVWK